MTSLKCCLCQTKTEDSLNLGEFKKTGKYTAHYYCLLLASDIKQSGRDNHGILGFLASDIMKQVKISEKRVCKYCRKNGATIICNTKHCRKYFHLPCGLKNGTSHQFYGQFKSRCAKHKYRQPYKKPSEDVSCLICCELIHFHWKQMHQVLWAPCCQKNGFFHRACIQQMALSAGLYFFKCPFCNNQDKFQKAMQHNGVFIPERDASWELVPGAFDDLMFRHNECNAKDCLAPRGRKFEGSGGWLMVLCSMCGSQGTHVTCSQLKKKLDWICTQCTTVTSTNPTTSTTNSTSSNTNTPTFTTNHSSSTTNPSISTINPSSSTKNPSTSTTSRSSSSTDDSPLNSTNLPSNSENPPPEPTVARPIRRSPRKSSTQSQKPPRSTNTPPTPLESSENPPPTRNSVVKIIETIIDACKITGADPADPALLEPRRCTRQSTSTIINNNIPAGSGSEINSKCTKSSATTSCHSETNRKRRKTIDKDFIDTNLQDITIKPIAPPKDTDKSVVREQLNQSETIADTSIRLYSPQQSTDVLNIINNPERKQNSTLNNNGQSRPVDIRQETTIISPFHCSNRSCDCFTVKPTTSARSKPNLKRARAISRQCIENSREIKLNSRRELRNTTTVCNNTQIPNNKSISSCNTLFANIPAAEQSYNLYESTYDCTTNTFNIIPIPNKNINTVPVEYYEQDSNGQFIRTQEPTPCTQINDVRVQSLSISATASNSTLNKQTRINIVHVHQHGTLNSSEKQINKESEVSRKRRSQTENTTNKVRILDEPITVESDSGSDVEFVDLIPADSHKSVHNRNSPIRTDSAVEIVQLTNGDCVNNQNSTICAEFSIPAYVTDENLPKIINVVSLSNTNEDSDNSVEIL